MNIESYPEDVLDTLQAIKAAEQYSTEKPNQRKRGIKDHGTKDVKPGLQAKVMRSTEPPNSKYKHEKEATKEEVKQGLNDYYDEEAENPSQEFPEKIWSLGEDRQDIPTLDTENYPPDPEGDALANRLREEDNFGKDRKYG